MLDRYSSCRLWRATRSARIASISGASPSAVVGIDDLLGSIHEVSGRQEGGEPDHHCWETGDAAVATDTASAVRPMT